jgi:hypothetical protein
MTLPVLVGHAFGGAPAEGVFVQVDADHLVGRQVAVFDALLQAVGVDGLAEVVGVGVSVSLGVAVRPIWVALPK